MSIWRPKWDSDEQGEYLAADETVMSQVRKIVTFLSGIVLPENLS